jgi:hypothetical protein
MLIYMDSLGVNCSRWDPIFAGPNLPKLDGLFFRHGYSQAQFFQEKFSTVDSKSNFETH